MRELIKEVVELTVPIEEVGIEDDLMNLGMNSINSIKVIVAIEGEFGFEFDDEDLNFENFRNIRKLVSYIESRMQK
ncbi:MAG: hypothetical protein HPY74_15340 [Firmicutes bacterium]|nr:hypothetical protein [Bacillota bacterium]